MPPASSHFRIVFVIAGCAIAAACITAGWFAVRMSLQYRATYAGDLTFVGSADGADVRYVRFFIWKPPDYTDSLPDMTVIIEGTSYPIHTLTPEILNALGGSMGEGALFDAAGNILQYRFENNRLTGLSLVPSGRAPAPAKVPNLGGNIRAGTFQIAVNEGEAFSLPISGQDLKRYCGPPLSIRRGIAN